MNPQSRNIEQEAAEESERNAAKSHRSRAYRTLVLTVTTITVGFYIAGAVYALVTI